METEDPRWAAQMVAAPLAVLDAMTTVIDRWDELMLVAGAAPDAEHALHALQSAFGFDDVQAHAVLDLQVRRFSERERSRIAEERDSLRRTLDETRTDL